MKPAAALKTALTFVQLVKLQKLNRNTLIGPTSIQWAAVSANVAKRLLPNRGADIEEHQRRLLTIRIVRGRETPIIRLNRMDR